MSAVNVSLTGKLAEFVEDRVASGDFGSAQDVVSHAVGLYSDDYDRKLTALRAAINEGLAEIEAGHFSEISIKEIVDQVLLRASK